MTLIDVLHSPVWAGGTCVFFCFCLVAELVREDRKPDPRDYLGYYERPRYIDEMGDES